MTVKKEDLDFAKDMAEAGLQNFSERANDARVDAKKDQRVALRECMWCFYAKNMRFGGSAFTEYTCRHCKGVFTHSSIAVPYLCAQCSSDLNACVRCMAPVITEG